MPYATRRRKSYRKSAAKGKSRRTRSSRNKSRGSRKSRAIRSLWKNPLSQTCYRRFVYTDSDFTNDLTGLGVSDSYLFRGNSCYDPDATGVGVQPYGWDQYTPDLYNFYKVTASKITIYFTTSADVRHLRVFLIPIRGTSLTYTEGSDLGVTPYCKSLVYSSENGTTRKAKISHYMSTGRFIKESSPRDTSYNAQYNANPALGWNWIFYTERNSNLDECTVYFDVKIKYYTILSKSQNIDES